MSKTILIAEDHSDSRELLSLLVQHFGYTAIAVSSGEEAIDAAIARKPKIIFMDLSLPGMSGIEAASRIKNNPDTSAIPIVAFSAWSQRAWRNKALEAGMAMYLTKPATAEAIKSTIETAEILSSNSTPG